MKRSQLKNQAITPKSKNYVTENKKQCNIVPELMECSKKFDILKTKTF